MKKLILPIVFVFALFQITEAQVPKKVLVEKFTSAGCGNCPDGTARLINITANNPDIIWVSLHAGWINDAFGDATQDSIAAAFTDSAPKANMNRVKFNNEITVATVRNNWNTHITNELAMTSNVDVQVSGNYNPTTRLVEIQVTSTFQNAITANGTYRVNLYVVEDSVVGSGSGYDQSNYFNNTMGHYYQGAGHPILNYPHRNVVRAVPSSAWGTQFVIPPTPSQGGSYTANYVYTLPADFDPTKVRFVGFVTDHSDLLPENRPVLNVNETHLNDFNIITNTQDLNAFVQKFSIQPNPAIDFVNLNIQSMEDQNISLSVTNTMGQEVFSNQNQNLISGDNIVPLDIQNLNTGIYFITIRNGNQMATQKLVVR
jgi:hypothetical protein